MAKRGETIVLQASRRYKLWLASFCLLCLLLMGIFYLSPKGGPISMILFWLLFVGVLGLVNCTRSGDIVLTAKYLSQASSFVGDFLGTRSRRFGQEMNIFGGVAKQSMERRKGPVRISLIIGADSAKATGSKFPRIWRSNGLKKIRSVGSEEERKQLIRKLRTNRPPAYCEPGPN